MMCKSHIRTSLALIIVIMIIMPSVKVKPYESNKLLILYDSYKEYGEKEEKLSYIIKATLATNNEIKIKKMSKYEKGECDSYKGIIILSNEENSINNQMIEDAFYYKGKCIFLGPNNEKIMEKVQKKIRKPIKIVANDEYNGLLIRELDNIAFIEEVSNKNLSYFIFRNYVLRSLGQNKDYSKNYLMIDKVYAITNLNELMEKIDYLHNQGIKAIFSIMPVYENANLKAMKNYTEVLRYAQSKGVIMFFHSADIYREGTAVKDIYDRMKLGYSNYINYQVYPVALDIPNNWLCFEDYKMIFNKSNTLAVDRGEDVEITYLEEYTLNSVENFLEKVDLSSLKSIDEQLINQNFIFKIPNSLKFEEFKKVINLIKDKNINISDPKHLNMKVDFNGNIVVTNNISGIHVYESLVDLKGNVYPQSAFKESETKATKEQGFSLKQLNLIIIFVTVGASVIFVIITFISKRIDRRKYFK